MGNALPCRRVITLVPFGLLSGYRRHPPGPFLTAWRRTAR
jgi:hypothetical protein